MKAWYKSKTIIFNGLMATLALVETADLSFLPEDYRGVIVFVAAVGNIWLRLMTNQGIGK